MVSAIALVAGVSAVIAGSLLLRTWIRHGGASGTTHFKRVQILGHASVGILGVILLIVHLAAIQDPRWGWTTVVVLFTASALGATMYLPWWRRGRKGLYGDNDPAGFYPAEDHFPMRTVLIHGGFADLTWILLIIALLVT
ncbi:hypothetical protein MLP_05550 [Microlunatus phosphovorus NM-1]|uniref:Uncharacterized protein n=1 Tax=Microlunatus phosphovorus (strain ATCC 700054 / DSM 10555 / JCM 9379 / NBRC 101784 / NCIMB 13414 / VKM Ac-1990 / NM-1) TaxID=1032480 RepID=F5XK73_MICPN|nr:hypothetical protein [Microlunatus phosphovorus]BAK33569.1 hypothetical protein MLP_05550 [Microlunatus phosphovorus NM-1]